MSEDSLTLTSWQHHHLIFLIRYTCDYPWDLTSALSQLIWCDNIRSSSMEVYVQIYPELMKFDHIVFILTTFPSGLFLECTQANVVLSMWSAWLSPVTYCLRNPSSEWRLWTISFASSILTSGWFLCSPLLKHRTQDFQIIWIKCWKNILC
jgi:hypothetical protein